MSNADGEGDETDRSGSYASATEHELNNVIEMAELNLNATRMTTERPRTTPYYDDEKENNDKAIEKQDQMINGLSTVAVQIAIFYCGSQAIIYTSLIGGSSSLKCHNSWFPLVLSLLPGGVSLWGLYVIGKRYIKVYIQRDQSHRVRAEYLFPDEKSKGEQHFPVDRALEKSLNTYLHILMSVFACIALCIAFGGIWMGCIEKLILKHHDADDAKYPKICDGVNCIGIYPKSLALLDV